MTQFVILSDDVVRDILMSLTRDEIITCLGRIEECLRSYSVGDERQYQPEPAIVNRADGRKNLFRQFTSSGGVGVKIIVDPSKAIENDKTMPNGDERNRLMGLHGILALCDQNGFPSGIINAEEITGYRTTLSAMIGYIRRQKVAKIVVFGAGKQALWHLRLALALRGDEVESIFVINRSVDRTQRMLDQIKAENQNLWKSSAKLSIILADDKKGVESAVGTADVIFCTTPSREVLFPAQWLETRSDGCYISAIGSWQEEMIEIDPQLLIDAAKKSHSSMVIVDDRKECMKSAGEVIRSNLGDDQLAEVGEVLDLILHGSGELQQRTKQCITTGFVVYKSVGVSMTDLAAGQVILELARKRSKGIPINNF